MINKEKNTGQKNLKNFIREFEKFSNSLKESIGPISEKDLIDFQYSAPFSVPEEYLLLLSYSNGFSLMGDEIYGIGCNCLGLSMEDAYHIEHDLVENPMPSHIIPFSPDGAGNHYCFDSNNGHIIFWQHDLPCNINLANYVYDNLFDMIEEVFFEWTLEDWNYDGTRK